MYRHAVHGTPAAPARANMRRQVIAIVLAWTAACGAETHRAADTSQAPDAALGVADAAPVSDASQIADAAHDGDISADPVCVDGAGPCPNLNVTFSEWQKLIDVADFGI